MKKVNTTANAAIIVIGNEILSGRTQDINVSFLCKWLNDLGVRVTEVRIIEDNEDSIVKNINELKNKFKYIFTTGGIGPTHDDITSKSIAKAFNKKYGFHKEAKLCLNSLWGKFGQRNNKTQVDVVYSVKELWDLLLNDQLTDFNISVIDEKVEKFEEFQKGMIIKIREIRSIRDPKVTGSFII